MNHSTKASAMTKRLRELQSWPWASYRQALKFADSILSKPPRYTWLRRVEGVGQRIVRFALPLELCPTANETLEYSRIPIRSKRTGKIQMIKPQEGKRKRELAGMMLAESLDQGWNRSRGPLQGRPMLRCIRFSAQKCDPGAGFCKAPIDQLTMANDGLAFLVDDDWEHCDPWETWEPSPTRAGCVLIEVWTGTP